MRRWVWRTRGPSLHRYWFARCRCQSVFLRIWNNFDAQVGIYRHGAVQERFNNIQPMDVQSKKNFLKVCNAGNRHYGDGINGVHRIHKQSRLPPSSAQPLRSNILLIYPGFGICDNCNRGVRGQEVVISISDLQIHLHLWSSVCICLS